MKSINRLHHSFLLLMCLSTMVYVGKANAQSNAVKEFTVFAEILTNSSYNETNPSVASTDTVKATAVLVLEDTTNIAGIHINMGASAGASDLLSKEFPNDGTTDFSDGTSLRKEGNIIYLVLGKFLGMNHFYTEAYIRKTDNTLTPTVTFSR